MKNSFAFRMSVILFCVAFLAVGLVSHAGDSLSDLNSQQNEIEQKKEEIQQQLDEQQAELEANQEKIAALEKEKAARMSEKEDLVLQLEEIFEALQEIEQTIKETEAEYERKVSLLKERTRIMYQTSSYTEMQMFIESDSLLEYINRKSYYNAMIEKDQQLIDEVVALKADLESKKELQSESQAAYEKLLAEKEAAIAKLEADEDYLSSLSDSTKSMIDKLEAQEEEMEAESKKIAEQIRKLQSSSSSSGSSGSSGGSYNGSGKFLWPSAASTYISSYFGMRLHPIYGYWRMHNGIDIAAAGGTNILAAESGTVIVSEWQTNGGYGQYVVIDHGNGYSTLYAHASKLIAKVGQKVERGDVIALVGTTGNSTGNHLHFEVRVNGNPVNPLDYL